MLGYCVLLGCAAGSLSLLTWSAADPSLTHATSGDIRNLLGPFGAILADLLMQMLGLAGVFVLLPPLFWALQLVTAEHVARLRLKLVLAPLSIMFLAGAFSALPAAAGWPLHHGFGGLLGDFGLAFLSSLLAAINPDRAPAAAGLFCFAGGMLVLVGSLGLSHQDLRLICHRSRGFGLGRLSKLWREFDGFARVRREPTLTLPPEPAASAPMSARASFRALHDASDFDLPPSHPAPEPELAVDASLDQSSRAIAQRFAPAREAPIDPAPTIPLESGGGWHIAPGGRKRDASSSLRPPLGMLKRTPAPRAAAAAQGALRGQAQLLLDVLNDFGVRGELKAVHPGPVVTLFEFEPARGTKSARIIALADDIARSMSAASARIAVVPGRNAIGIELPNLRRDGVFLRELLEADAYRASDATLPLALGKSIDGTPVCADLARMPHLLVAGTTGAGKSVGINAMILSLLYRLSPDECRFLLIDPKMLELSIYNGIPHLLCPVVTDAEKAVAALNWAVREMEERYRRMAKLSVRNIDVFNNRIRSAMKRGSAGAGEDCSPMPFIVIVVDEFADLMAVAGKEIEAAVQRLAQMARAAGIHLIMATQRPSVDVITGTIKANFPTRISFKVASKFDSRTILNEQGAEQLLGQGDMLFAGGNGRVLRVHGPFVSDEEVEVIVRHLRAAGPRHYIDGITDVPEQPDVFDPPARSADNDLYQRAVAVVLRDRKPSTSYLQRRLSIGYVRAADLIERMEGEGLISPLGPSGRRIILRDPPGASQATWRE